VFGELTIDFGARRVTVADRYVELTRTEFDLLAHLALNAGRVITHRALLQAVWGPEYSDETEYLWTYIRRLRHKIEPNPRKPQFILTQAGVGYTFLDLT
jgi:two-component system KDP operon response regulator KdpE